MARNLPFNPRADNAGREPQVGDYVAYNYSGQIATGYIRQIGQGRWNKRFYITQVIPEEGHESVVNGGPKCLLVLVAAEHAEGTQVEQAVQGIYDRAPGETARPLR